MGCAWEGMECVERLPAVTRGTHAIPYDNVERYGRSVPYG